MPSMGESSQIKKEVIEAENQLYVIKTEKIDEEHAENPNEAMESCDTYDPVSYTHLTLPTNREV